MPKYEYQVQRLTADDLKVRLAKFEARYNMASAEFFRKYNSGTLTSESDDFVTWAIYCDMAAQAGALGRRSIGPRARS